MRCEICRNPCDDLRCTECKRVICDECAMYPFGKRICEECFNQLYVKCEECEIIIPVESVIKCESCGKALCDVCAHRCASCRSFVCPGCTHGNKCDVCLMRNRVDEEKPVGGT